VFWVIINLPIAAGYAEEIQPALSFAGKNILLMDQCLDLCKIIESRVTDAQSILCATSIDQIRNTSDDDDEHPANTRYDAIVLDYQMEGITDESIAAWVKQYPTYQEVPVVLLCETSARPSETPLKEAHITHVIERPVAIRHLLATIHEVLQPPTEVEFVEKVKEPEPSVESVEPLKILVAEDNQVNRLVIAGMLKKLHHKFECAEDGVEVVAFFKDKQFDLILMDCEMPNMSGIDATKKIRALEADGGRNAIPIVALTAHALSHQEQACREAGMNDFCSKPIELAKLSSIINGLFPS
jgi:CheY-like chemotaxis protein